MSSKDKSSKNKNKEKKIGNFWQDFVKISGAIPTLLWIRPKTVYLGTNVDKNGKRIKKLKGGALLASNHVGFHDPIILTCAFWYRRLRYLTLSEVFKSKAGNFFFTHMHCIPVDRDNFKMSTFRRACDALSGGKAVVIFPEGHINSDADANTLPFKSGVILIAHKANAPIVPVYIVNRRKWYSRQVVLVGDPIDVREMCGERATGDALNKASEYVRDKVLELYEIYTAELEKKKSRRRGKNEIEK